MHGDDETKRPISSDASNRDYARYDQVSKDQTYRLSETSASPVEERFDDSFEIRTCDLGDWLQGGAAERQGFASEIGRALREIGFAILVGHGIDPCLFAAADRAVYTMFDRSVEEKLRFRAARHGAVNQGYFPIEETTEIHPDRVEGWVLCRRAFQVPGGAAAGDTDRFWPAPALEAVFRELCLAEERLVLPIMQSVLTFLDCDPHLYDARLSRPSFGLRLNYYPPLDGSTPGAAARLLGHEDVDLFTFLPAPGDEGLQVLNRQTMSWVRLDPPPGSIILNTGDYMQRVTNDVLPSTTHRVSQPRTAAARSRPRVSYPMNVYLGEKELLEVLPGLGAPRYAAIRAIEFHTRTTAKYYGDDYAVGDGESGVDSGA